ncbi:MAG: hypothetical protein ACFFF4_12820 [Candidatus Thorarchaeota archaeon]
MKPMQEVSRETKNLRKISETPIQKLAADEILRIINDYRLDSLSPEEQDSLIREYNRIRNIKIN